MDRVVFCPSEDKLDEAIEVAKEWALPIQIGDSDRTKDMSFNRDKVGVLVIPINHYFLPFPAIAPPNQPLSADYYNDFVDCSKLEFFLSTEQNLIKQVMPMQVMLYDKHHAVLPLFLDSEGHYKITVKLDGEQIAALEFAVSNGNESDIGAYA